MKSKTKHRRVENKATNEQKKFKSDERQKHTHLTETSIIYMYTQ